MRLLGLMGTVKVRLLWKEGWAPEGCLSLSPPPGAPSLAPVPLGCRWRRWGRTGEAVMGEKLAGRKPNRGEGEGEGAGEKGDWLEMGEKQGVPERELPSDTSMVAASHSSKSKRDEKSWGRSEGRTRRGRESPPLLLASLLSRDVSSQSNSLLARPRERKSVV